MNKNGKYTLIFVALAENPLKRHDLATNRQKDTRVPGGARNADCLKRQYGTDA